jgi:hypothetical protein
MLALIEPLRRLWLLYCPGVLRIVLVLGLVGGSHGCAVVNGPSQTVASIDETATLIQEVKDFAKSIGIEPTAALSRTDAGEQSLSMLWLWLQRAGTLALRGPIDVRLAIGFSAAKERIPLEQVYRIDGYSVYYRQGNEFSDPRAAATASFAEEEIIRRVKVILHEDLHDDQNFSLPWEIEEGIVTPLGSLAAVEFFRRKGDNDNARRALISLADESAAARELVALAAQAEAVFKAFPPESGKDEVLALLPNYSHYQRQFHRQIRGQHPPTVLEAKLSHDLAYYRFFDAIVTLAEKAPDLARLIRDLKRLGPDAGITSTENYVRALESAYAPGRP